MPHLRKIRKYDRFCKSASFRICYFRNSFADFPPLYSICYYALSVYDSTVTMIIIFFYSQFRRITRYFSTVHNRSSETDWLKDLALNKAWKGEVLGCVYRLSDGDMSQPQIATDPKDFGQLFLEGLKCKRKMRSFAAVWLQIPLSQVGPCSHLSLKQREEGLRERTGWWYAELLM